MKIQNENLKNNKNYQKSVANDNSTLIIMAVGKFPPIEKEQKMKEKKMTIKLTEKEWLEITGVLLERDRECEKNLEAIKALGGLGVGAEYWGEQKEKNERVFDQIINQMSEQKNYAIITHYGVRLYGCQGCEKKQTLEAMQGLIKNYKDIVKGDKVTIYGERDGQKVLCEVSVNDFLNASSSDLAGELYEKGMIL